MALPITIPNEFANATTSIPLSNLDANFVVVADAINGIGNGSEALANVNITGGAIDNVAISNASGIVANTVEVIAGTGLTGGGNLSANVTLTMADTAVSPATYGGGSNAAQLTVDQQGRITSAANVAIPQGTVTNVATGTGLTGGPITATGTISLANTTVSAGTFGNATSVSTFTVNAQGQLTAASNTTIAIANTQVSGLGTMSTQDASNVAITGGSLANTALGTPPSGTLSNCTVDGTDAVGFRNVPVNSQSANYTLVLADSGKTILHPIADNNARTFTIPANSSVAYPVGTAVTFVNLINTVTISITSDTMYLANAGTTGSRTLAAYGMATAIKVASTTWVISGNGLT